jgi:RNA polymerase sigma-70 factor (ECF subfamily)
VTTIDTLYREHAGRVYRFALSLSGNRAVAEDLTSETFVRLWTARERVDLTTVLGYLLTITRRLYLQGLPRERRGQPLVIEPADQRPGHDVVVEGRDALDAVLADLQTLPEPDRAALLMRAHDGLPYEEIAAALGISAGAVKVKVHRARQRLLGLRRAREERGQP